ncbi:MAG: hypothetical protein P9X24_07990 [Candidatus Hatepunaea meridiana]|nr:hypothetical protein [Candidatus Hatepunaea meridiana]
MKGRDKLFFNLLAFLLLVIIALVGVKTREVDKQIKRWEAEIRRRQERGVEDPILKATVEKLESDLRSRLAETFNLREDPLDLVRVIPSLFGGKLETGNRMRLSCTVSGKDGHTAIIKYKNKNWVLMVGDIIGDKEHPYRVESIANNSVVLKRGVERMKLKTEKARDTMEEDERRYGPEGEMVPIIEVKKVLEGNL